MCLSKALFFCRRFLCFLIREKLAFYRQKWFLYVNILKLHCMMQGFKHETFPAFKASKSSMTPLVFGLQDIDRNAIM